MVNGTHICTHRDSTITWEEMDGEPITKFLEKRGHLPKYNPIWYVYFYGASRWSSECKLEYTKIGDDVYVLGYHPTNASGDLLRFGPDSMEHIEHNFSVKDFHNLHNHEIFPK